MVQTTPQPYGSLDADPGESRATGDHSIGTGDRSRAVGDGWGSAGDYSRSKGEGPADLEAPVRPGPVPDHRAEAVARLEKKRGWQAGMVAYVLVNAFLVGIWAVTGRGYFWPAWPLGGWGLGMALSYWDLYMRRPITEQDIEAELRRR